MTECLSCEKDVVKGFSVGVYDTPWDDVIEVKKFCSDECMEEYLYEGDFSYFCCGICNREICRQNPSNGYHTQVKILGGEEVCLRCYEKYILENGIDREDFENGQIPGMFFNVGNNEVLDKGYEEVGCYFISGLSRAKEVCDEAIALIDDGYKVVIGYERLAITGGEGSITMFKKLKEVS